MQSADPTVPLPAATGGARNSRQNYMTHRVRAEAAESAGNPEALIECFRAALKKDPTPTVLARGVGRYTFYILGSLRESAQGPRMLPLWDFVHEQKNVGVLQSFPRTTTIEVLFMTEAMWMGVLPAKWLAHATHAFAFFFALFRGDGPSTNDFVSILTVGEDRPNPFRSFRQRNLKKDVCTRVYDMFTSTPKDVFWAHPGETVDEEEGSLDHWLCSKLEASRTGGEEEVARAIFHYAHVLFHTPEFQRAMEGRPIPDALRICPRRAPEEPRRVFEVGAAAHSGQRDFLAYVRDELKQARGDLELLLQYYDRFLTHNNAYECSRIKVERASGLYIFEILTRMREGPIADCVLPFFQYLNGTENVDKLNLTFRNRCMYAYLVKLPPPYVPLGSHWMAHSAHSFAFVFAMFHGDRTLFMNYQIYKTRRRDPNCLEAIRDDHKPAHQALVQVFDLFIRTTKEDFLSPPSEKADCESLGPWLRSRLAGFEQKGPEEVAQAIFHYARVLFHTPAFQEAMEKCPAPDIFYLTTRRTTERVREIIASNREAKEPSQEDTEEEEEETTEEEEEEEEERAPSPEPLPAWVSKPPTPHHRPKRGRKRPREDLVDIPGIREPCLKRPRRIPRIPGLRATGGPRRSRALLRWARIVEDDV